VLRVFFGTQFHAALPRERPARQNVSHTQREPNKLMPITNDAVILGLLCATLGAIFWTTQSASPFWLKFYKYVPALVLCYFLPALYNTTGLIESADSSLYAIATRYLLPATLILLTLSIDFPAIARLGPKAIVLFLTGTVGVMIGGPIALLLWGWLSPGTVDGEVWRGMSTLAGSWIGGGANQAAMKEVFNVDDNLFGMMVAVDIVIGSIWMAFLLYLAGRADELDAKRGADTRAIADLREQMTRFEAENTRPPKLPDYMVIVGLGFGGMGLSHLLGTPLAASFKGQVWAERMSLASDFFWIVVIATTIGVLLSLTRARRLEGVGASKLGTLLLYVLIATIGMQMDLGAILTNPGLFGVGATWILIHGGLILLVAYLIKAPVFYMAVGSQANIGAAASAPVVASAFHPSLAPVGVLLAVLGYALGTYCGWLTGLIMGAIAGQ
jgi:uncharacterized membrane protein